MQKHTRLTHFILTLLIFSLIYPITNLYGTYLHQYIPIPSIIFPIDYMIEFIPPMIIFYSCSWLLFIGGFFIIQQQQLTYLTSRLILATILAGLCYYYFPLRFSFHREDFIFWQIDWQIFYDLLMQIDEPFNQPPSLHVTYAILIAYSMRSTEKTWHIVYRTLFYMISILTALSTLFTWQHHSIDIICGILFAIAIILLDNHLSTQKLLNHKKNIIKYLTLAIISFILLATLPIIFNLSIPLQYFSLALAYYLLFSFILIAFLYYRNNQPYQTTLTKICYKNNNGKLSPISRILLIPLQFIYYIMWSIAQKTGFCQTQKNPIMLHHYHHIELIATGKLKQADFNQLINHYTQRNYRIIYIDNSIELSTPSFYQHQLSYYHIPMLDLTVYDHNQYPRLHHHLKKIEEDISSTEKNLIICQCVMGRSRSVAMMACLLAYLGRYTIDDIQQNLQLNLPKHLATPYIDHKILSHFANIE